MQAIIINKNYYTLKEANKIIKNIGKKPIKKVHETKNYYRFRLQEPSKNKKY